MLGFGKKNDKQPVVVAPESEPSVTPPYDINNEVVFHVMPSHFKKQTLDAKQAQKTGLIIMVIAIILIISLVLVLAWYFLFNGKNSQNKSNMLPSSQTEIATTTEKPVITQDVVSPATTSMEVVQATTTTESASSSVFLATSSPATTSDQTSNINQAPLVIASSTDTDGDGLTDAEEAILGTNKDKADTDGDGYSDLAEFIKGYNPAGAGKLNPKVIGAYQNANFSLSYPASWQFTSSGNDSVIFRTSDEQMVQISLQPDIANQSITDWYKAQFGKQEILGSQFISQVDAGGNALWQGIFSPNHLTVYLTNDKKQTIASINYDLGFSGKLNYKQIFLFMINSFVLKN